MPEPDTPDLSEIHAFRRPPKLRCRTCRLLAGIDGGLSETDREMLRDALADVAETQLVEIADWLATKGIIIDPQTVGRHRNKGCQSRVG